MVCRRAGAHSVPRSGCNLTSPTSTIGVVRETGGVAMREDCVHFQSRSYDDGETARFCTLDLAPEAPWRCPEDCARYERLVMASDLDEGSLARTPVEAEPDAAPGDVAAVLDEAEEIVNAAVPGVLADLEPSLAPWWRRFTRRTRSDREDGPGLRRR